MRLLSGILALTLLGAACTSPQPSSPPLGGAPSASSAGVTPTSPPNIAPPAPPAAPTAIPTPTRDQRLADMYAKQDWPAFIQELEPDQQRGTLAPQYTSSLYGAYINQGEALFAAGNRDGARTNANKALQLDPTRGEASALLLKIDPPPTATPAPTRPAPTAAPPRPPAGAGCATAVEIPNPWCYNFTTGSFITSPPSNFCSYFSCIGNFWNGRGYVMQCRDGMFGKSGGIQGSCSGHGGNARALRAP